MRFRYVLLLLLLFAIAEVSAQNRILPSNSDYGFSGVLFFDDVPYSQEDLDVELARIEYSCHFKQGQRNISFNSILQIGRNITKYNNKERFEVDSILLTSNNIASIAKRSMKGNPVFFFDTYYVFNDKNRVEFTTRLGSDDFQYQENIPEIKWDRCSDSLIKICGYPCKKATTTFKGRNYIAYYTEEIPASAGPWLFQGLPGVILYIYDEEQLFSFRSTHIAFLGASIKKPKYPYITIKKTQYLKLLQNLEFNYYNFINQHIGRSNVIEIGSADLNQNHSIEIDLLERVIKP